MGDVISQSFGENEDLASTAATDGHVALDLCVGHHERHDGIRIVG